MAPSDARRLTTGQLVEALATCKEAAAIARAVGSLADLARVALGAHHAETWLGRSTRETAELLDAAFRNLALFNIPVINNAKLSARSESMVCSLVRLTVSL